MRGHVEGPVRAPERLAMFVHADQEFMMHGAFVPSSTAADDESMDHDEEKYEPPLEVDIPGLTVDRNEEFLHQLEEEL